MISLKKYILYFILIDLAVVNSQIKSFAGFSTQLSIIIITICLLFYLPKKSFFLNISGVKIIILTYFLFIFLSIVGHGPTIGTYFYRFTRLLPLFFAGLIIGKDSKHIKLVFIFFTVGLFISNLGLIYSGGTSSVRNTEIGVYDDFFYSPYRYLSITISSLISYYLYLNASSLYYKFVFLILFIVTVFVLIIGGFTTPIICFIFSFLMFNYFVFFNKNSSSKMLNKIISLSIFVLIFYMGTYFLDITVLDRLTAFASPLYGSNTSFNETSGGRVVLNLISIDVFLNNPIIGIGSYAFIPGIYVIGGHSTIFDILAQFGLIVGGCVLLLIFNWLYSAYLKYKILKTNQLSILLMSIWAMYILGCFFNPYLFSSGLDHIVFVLAGITLTMIPLKKIN